MKSVSAYTSKIKAETQGKTQKVQNDGRTVTTGLYRGVSGCNPQNYNQIIYPLKSYGSGCFLLLHGKPRFCSN